MDTEEKCRLCLSSTDIIPIFSDELEKDVPIQTKIMVCLSTPVTRCDVLPKGVCSICLKRVEQFYDFRELCIRSFMQLQVFTTLSSSAPHSSTAHEGNNESPEISYHCQDLIPRDPETRTVHLHGSNIQFIAVKQESLLEEDSQRASTSSHNLFVKPETFLHFSGESGHDNLRDVCEVQVSELNVPHEANHTGTLSTSSEISRARKGGRRKTYDGELVCEICDKKFNKKYNFIRHQEIHDNIFHPCSVCEKIFRRQVDLREHERTHTGTAPFRCEDCGKPFYNSSKFKMHKHSHKIAFLKKKISMEVQGTESGGYDCNVCATVCQSGEDLLIHLHENHPGLDAFRCGRCGVIMSSKRELENHIITNHEHGLVN